jgi:hypothetical protein
MPKTAENGIIKIASRKEEGGYDQSSSSSPSRPLTITSSTTRESLYCTHFNLPLCFVPFQSVAYLLHPRDKHSCRVTFLFCIAFYYYLLKVHTQTQDGTGPIRTIGFVPKGLGRRRRPRIPITSSIAATSRRKQPYGDTQKTKQERIQPS